LEGVSIDLGGGDVGVAKEFLDGADVVTRFKQVCREGMAEGVAANRFWDAGKLDGVADRALEDEFVEMMAALFAGTGVFRYSTGGENPLPGPLASRIGIFTVESLGQENFAETVRDILFMEDFDAGEMFLEGCCD
jgi:hypothetical protein